MRLILSKNSFWSLGSIENIDHEDHLHFHEEHNISFEIPPLEDDQPEPKVVPVATQEYFQTPIKKKKGGCVCKKTGCIKLYC